MASLITDVRHAIRATWRSPLLTLTAAISIGLGVGANTTVFAWLDNIVRHPFPAIPDGGGLVALNVADRDGRVEGMSPVAWPTLQEWQARLTMFEGIAAHAQTRLYLREGAVAVGEPIWVEMTAANFFDVLGIHAARGRTFAATDEAFRAPVVVLRHAFWQRRFGGENVIGRTLLFNGAPLTVIGIAPARFTGVVMGLTFDAWVPLWLQPTLLPGADWMRDRAARRLQAVARLRDGASLSGARQELLAAALAVSRSYGDTPPTGAGARWVSDTQLGSLIGPLSLAMLAITVVVLTAASANVAALLLARAAGQQRETAIQVALGASRGRLVRQALAHAGILALAGGAAGLAIARITKDAIVVFVPRVGLPLSIDVDLNWRVAVFAAAATAAAALLFALVPALRASRPDVIATLRSSTGTGIVRRSRLRQGLVAAQVAFSLLALSTAGLFLRSVAAARDVPLGFDDPGQLLLAATDLSFTRSQGEARAAIVDRLLQAARALPGVTAASAATAIPLSFGRPAGVAATIDGYVPNPGESMFVGRVIVTDGYFETMGIPIVAGRAISPIDRPGSARVVVVNQSFVRRYLGPGDPVGRRLDHDGGWATVVGVARDSMVDNLTDPPRPLVYHPYAQVMPDALTLHLRTPSEPLTLVAPLGQALRGVHADLPVLDPRTLADHMGAATFVQSVGAGAFGAFGLIALAIAATGLYGVMAASVAERRREIAVSVAMGAAPSDVVRAVAAPAVRVTSLGLAVGAGLTVGAASLVRNQLIGVSPVDPASLLAGAGALALVALAACVGPAWRALRLNPAAILRP
jgi:predicted permease